MNIRECFQVACPPEQVWRFIRDPLKIAACIPSVQSIRVLDEGHYVAVVKQKIGIISATFEIHTEIVDQTPPERLVLSNTGKTIFGASGNLRSADIITLRRLASDRTEVTIESELVLGGQLAVLGAKMIESKSKEIIAAAAANLKTRLEAVGPHGTPVV